MRIETTACRGLLLAAVAASLSLAACSLIPVRHTTWTTDHLRLSVDGRGRIVRLVDRATGQDHLARVVPSHLLSVRVEGMLVPPRALIWAGRGGTARLDYPGGITARVQVTPKPTHLVFELLGVEPAEQVELVVWGPYATTISETVAETVGVVRDSVFAFGLQALNPKTLGGYPWNENDCMPQLDLFESGDYSDLSEAGKRYVLYRVEAAKPDSFGSTLQAYCRDRSRERVVENWGHQAYTAPPFEDGGVAGSAIALFGAPAGVALETIGRIELAQGLPHPMIDGEWGKTTRSAAAAYLILDFSEADIDRAIAHTRQAGLRWLYHSGPFRTWGHFELGAGFPNGWAGMGRCVEKAEAAGVHVGVHTLSNFITTNDPYVTPVPDPRLARVGAEVLTVAVDAGRTELVVSAPGLFDPADNNTLRTVMIGSELVQYRDVSVEPPWRLLDCRRGAFGTAAVPHPAGSPVALLADHAYRVFLTDADLGREMAAQLAAFYNETGVRQISFDGVEGNRSTGMGNYGEILFTSAWFDHLAEPIRSGYIADASRTSHYFWHIYTRMNWGEPWYAGFRESQTEYRLKNQPYFRRNLMPGMLGWFRMTAQTTLEDVEWMLARSAAFDAGYAFVTDYRALEGNGSTDRILAAIGRWEQARLAGAFRADQKRRMEDVGAEFHLEGDGPDTWRLVPVEVGIFRYGGGSRQPGEPADTTVVFTNPGPTQTFDWIVTAEEETVREVRLTLDDGSSIRLAARLEPGWSLRYEEGDRVVVEDAEHRSRGTVEVDAAAFRAAPGRHTLHLAFTGMDAEGSVRLEVRLRGVPEPLTPP